MFRHLAEQARVPVVCHIDHATSVAECQAGIDYGFTSVMIDGSRLPLADNIDLTSAVRSLLPTLTVFQLKQRLVLLGMIMGLCPILQNQMKLLSLLA